MVFVTVICLVVAAYFLWEALKDKKNAEAGNSLSTAQRISSSSTGNLPAADYKNTGGAAQGDKTAATSAQSMAASTTAAPASSTSPDTSGIAKPDTTAHPAVSDARESANDANVKLAAGVAGAATAVAAVASSTDAGQGLRFLDGPIGRKDDLTRINGVGPVIEEGLNRIGIFHYHQIANFTENDIRNVDAELDFPGRIAREDWVEQARKLSSISLEQSTMEDTNEQLDSVVSIDEHAPNFTNPDSVLTDADYTGVWNTDVMIEIQERLKVLNTRISDAPRLRMTRDEYTAIKANEDQLFSRDRLLEILDRLRELD